MSASFNYYGSNNVWSYATAFPTTKFVNAPPKYYASVKPTAPKPAAPKPVASKPVASKPVASKPVASKPVASKPVASKPVASKPVASKPVASKPVAQIAVANKATKASPVKASVYVQAKPQARNDRFIDVNKLPQLPPVNNTCYASPKVPPGVTRKVQVNLPTEYRQVNSQHSPDLRIAHKEKTTYQTCHRNVVVREQPRLKTTAVIFQAKNVAQASNTLAPKPVKAGPQMTNEYQMKNADFSRYFSAF